ncbi:MAG: hypothetical protein JNL11_04315 [Bdellovibrionaceae bacterium]|nr:hypothetical protein [Pseudobdellovibrionaceae bacterium]
MKIYSINALYPRIWVFSEDGVKIPSYSCVQHQYERAMKQAGVNHKSENKKKGLEFEALSP